MFIQCKSVEFSFLGLINKTYGTQEASLPAGLPLPGPNLKPDTLATSRNFMAMKPLKISGLVTDAMNKPLDTANVYIIKGSQLVAFARSNSGGEFTITNFIEPASGDTASVANSTGKDTANTYQVTVTAPGFQAESKEVIIHPAETISLKFELDKEFPGVSGSNTAGADESITGLVAENAGGSISGFVVKKDKSPVADALILAENKDGLSGIAKTQPNGKFSISPLGAGNYTISVSHDKLSFPVKKIDLQNDIDRKTIDFISYPGEISGTIRTGKAKTPVPGAGITVERIDLNEAVLSRPLEIKAIASKKGNYKIEGLDAGKYRLRVQARGFGTLIREVEISTSKMQIQKHFELSGQGIIAGRLTHYRPGEEPELMLVDETNQHSFSPGDFKISPDGSYLIKGISAGTYTVFLKWKSMFVSRPFVKVKSGKTTPNINFILKEEPGYISGRVLSKDGNAPIENAIIIATSASNSGNYAVSDKDGNYHIKGLKPGNYTVTVSAPKHADANKSNLLLKNDAGLENIDFLLIKEN